MNRESENPASVLKKLYRDQLYTDKAKPVTDKTRNQKSLSGQLNIEKYIRENFSKPKQTEENNTKPIKETKSTEVYKTDTSADINISLDKLQEAVIWTEILGKPVCRRRKRYR